MTDRSESEDVRFLRVLLDGDDRAMLSVHETTGRYRFATVGATRLVGLEPEELVGRSMYDFVHPDDLDAVRGSHRGVMATPHAGMVTYRLRHTDGSLTTVKTFSWANRTPGGGPTEIIALTVPVDTAGLDEDRLRGMSGDHAARAALDLDGG